MIHKLQRKAILRNLMNHFQTVDSLTTKTAFNNNRTVYFTTTLHVCTAFRKYNSCLRMVSNCTHNHVISRVTW